MSQVDGSVESRREGRGGREGGREVEGGREGWEGGRERRGGERRGGEVGKEEGIVVDRHIKENQEGIRRGSTHLSTSMERN